MSETNERSVASAGSVDEPRNGALSGCETVCPHVRGTVTQHCSLNFTLTDAEREAIEQAIDFCEYTSKPLPRSEQIDTLRKLLERLHT